MRDTLDEILTVQEVAKRLRVRPSWVYGHTQFLGGYRLGKYVRFSWKRVLGQLELSVGTLGSQPNDLPEKP
jgi:hypothetical protein